VRIGYKYYHRVHGYTTLGCAVVDFFRYGIYNNRYEREDDMKKVFGIFAMFLFISACGGSEAKGIDALIADSEKNISILMDQFLEKGAFTKEALAEYDRIERAINNVQFGMEMDKKVTELQRTQLKQKLMDSGKRIEGIAAKKGVNLAEFNKKLDLEHINFLSVE
jgi:hypothetical protein